MCNQVHFIFAELPWIWISIDIPMDGYIHVWISDIGCPMDISMDIFT